MRYVIGIDQGSTKTFAAIADINGNILAAGKSTGAEHHASGIEYQVNRIGEACRDVLNKTAVQEKDVDFIFGGLSGVDWPEEASMLKDGIRKLNICDDIHIVNDCIVAFRGGTFSNFGAVICVGTGINCAVISPDGREFIYGFYAENSIQGSIALGRQVLDSVYKSFVGRLGHTKLTEKTGQKLGISDIEVLLRSDVGKKLDQSKIQSLAVDLFEAAYEGDTVAVDIIKWYGTQIAALVNARARIFGMEQMKFETIISGSVFKGPGSLLKDVVTAEIHAKCPKAEIVNARYEPVVGAAISALKSLNNVSDEIVIQNIERSSCKLGLIR